MRTSQLSSLNSRSDGINVGQTERAVSALAGGTLILLGLRQRGVGGALAALGGVALMQRGMTGHCSLYGQMGVNTAEDHPAGAEPHDYFQRGIHVEESVTIQRPLPELFDFWRNFENLPRFMSHVKQVQVLDGGKSHWVVEGPAGRD